MAFVPNSNSRHSMDLVRRFITRQLYCEVSFFISHVPLPGWSEPLAHGRIYKYCRWVIMRHGFSRCFLSLKVFWTNVVLSVGTPECFLPSLRSQPADKYGKAPSWRVWLSSCSPSDLLCLPSQTRGEQRVQGLGGSIPDSLQWDSQERCGFGVPFY